VHARTFPRSARCEGSRAKVGAGYRRARLSALAGERGSLGSRGEPNGVPTLAASNLASAARSGSRRGAWGYRSPSMTPRIAADTAASSSAGRSIVGTAELALPVNANVRFALRQRLVWLSLLRLSPLFDLPRPPDSSHDLKAGGDSH
jgi:hypothetical protein